MADDPFAIFDDAPVATAGPFELFDESQVELKARDLTSGSNTQNDTFLSRVKGAYDNNIIVRSGVEAFVPFAKEAGIAADIIGSEGVQEVAKAGSRGVVSGVPSSLSNGIIAVGEILQDSQKEAMMLPTTTGIQKEAILQGQKITSSMIKLGNDAKEYWGWLGNQGVLKRNEAVFEGGFMGNPSWTRGLSVAMESLPTTVIGLSVGLATKNPSLGLATMGSFEGVDIYAEARDKGVSVKKSAVLGVLAGGVVAITERAGSVFGPSFKRFATGQAVAKSGKISNFLMKTTVVKSLNKVMPSAVKTTGKIVWNGLKEGGQEVFEQSLLNVIRKTGIDSSISLLEGLGDSFIAGLFTGGLIDTTSRLYADVHRMYEEAKNNGATEQDLDTLVTATADVVIQNSDIIDQAQNEELMERNNLAKQIAETDLQAKAQAEFDEVKPKIVEGKEFEIEEEIDDEFFLDETIDDIVLSEVEIIDETPSKAVAKLRKLESRDAQREASKETLKDFIEIRKTFRKGIKSEIGSETNYKEVLPIKYQNAQGQNFDGVAQQLEELTGQELRTADDVYEYFQSLDKSIDMLKSDIKEMSAGFTRRKDITIAKEKVKIQERLSQEKVKGLVKGVQQGEKIGRAKLKEQIRESRKRKNKENKIKKTISKLKKAKLTEESADIFGDILEKVDTAKLTDKKAKSLQDIIKTAKLNPLNVISDKVIDNAIRRLNATPLSEMTSEQLTEIQDVLNHVAFISQEQNEIRVGKMVKKFKTAVNDTLNEVSANFYEKEGDISEVSFDSTLQKKTGLGQEFFGVKSWNLEYMTERLSNTSKQIFYDNIDAGTTEQLRFEQEAQDFFKDRIGDIDQKGWSTSFVTNKKDLKQAGYTFDNGNVKLTPYEKIALYLHSLSKKNRKHLLKGGIVSASKPEGKAVKLTNEDITFIQKESFLTEEENQVANAVYDYFNSIQNKKINAVSKKLLGVEIANENDYFPIRTNQLDRKRESLLKAGDKNFAKKTLEGLGALKERQDTKNSIILDDGAVALTKSVKDIASYVGLAEPLRYARALLNDNAFQKRARELNQEPTLREIEGYLDRIEGNSLKRDNLESLTLGVINNMDKAILSLNLFVIAKQPVSVFTAQTEIEGKYLKDNITSSVKDAVAEMRVNSPQLRNRVEGNISREMGELGSVGEALFLMTGEKVQNNAMLQGISAADTKAISIIWNSTKQKISETTKLEGQEYWNKVTEEAERIVRLTQPTFNLKDRSPLASNTNTFWRMVTRFGSQRNKNYIMMHRSLLNYNRSAKLPKDMSNLLSNMFIIAIMNSLGVGLIDNIRKGIKGQSLEDIAKGVPLQMVSSILGNVYGAGLIFDTLASKITSNWGGFDITNPVLDVANSFLDGVADIGKGITQIITNERFKGGAKKGQEKWQSSLADGAMQTIATVGMAKFGIPIQNIEFWYKAFFDRGEKQNKQTGLI